MKSRRGRALTEDVEPDHAGRLPRRSRTTAPDIEEARLAWEPVVCPECGTDHPDTVAIRLRRSGPEVEARCSDCGAVAARYTDGVWSA